MNTAMILQIKSTDSADTEGLGENLGSLLSGGEVIELNSDLGGGKTTFVKGLVKGIGSDNRVSSPTFTISKIYSSGKLAVHHFDFYRLKAPGIIADELKESLNDPQTITVVEWSNIVEDVLPENRIVINFEPVADSSEHRIITIRYPESKSMIIQKLHQLQEQIKP